MIIPALNEEGSIGKVVGAIPKSLVRKIIVVDNGSIDRTGEVASSYGAEVVLEKEKGYGAACLKGIDLLKGLEEKPEAVLFLDADFSDHPEESGSILEPMDNGDCDLCIGSRALGPRERGSMTPVQIFGNWLATRLMKLIYGGNFTDLGPFRAIRWESLMALEMSDRNFGWTIEMQIKALKKDLRILEVPVSYRRRIGSSKVSGTIKGSVLAGYKILFTIFKYSLKWKS